MKNKEELEKMFDEKFFWMSDYDIDEIKEIFFETIIKEVLMNIMSFDFQEEKCIAKWEWIALQEIKQKAKELFWIEL